MMSFSKMRSPETCIKYLYPLIIVCAIFGMCPPIFDGGKRKFWLICYKVYSVFIGVTGIVVTGVVVYQKTEFHSQLYIIKMSSIFIQCLLTAVCLMMIVSLVFMDTGRLLRDIFDSMDHANSQLNDGRRHKYSKKLYYKLVVYMVLILLYVIYDAYAQKHFLEEDWHIIFMSKAIQVCQFSVGMLLPMSLLKLIFLRIKEFNRALRKFIKSNQLQKLDSPDVNETFFYTMCDVHSDIFKMVRYVNRIFGFTMLSGTIMAMGLILHHINVILAYFQFGYVLETSMRPFVLAQSIFGILIPVFQVWVLARLGDQLAFEATKTPNITMIMLNEVLRNNPGENEKEEYHYQGLKNLGRQCALRRIYVSAARFFNVDHTMLGFVTSTLMSYIIMILQLMGTSTIDQLLNNVSV